MKVAALLTCFNRKEKTLSCLQSIYAQTKVEGLDLTIYMLDDGSTDGTSEAVMESFPDVVLLKGSGDLYWNRGMNVAWKAAIEKRFDYYMWVNDDVALRTSSFVEIFDALRKGRADCGAEPVIVGSFCEAGSGHHSYGGFKVKKTLFGITTMRIIPNGEITRCDTFNGNLVLIPDSVANAIGVLDTRYTHAFGDKDYGFRCMKNSIPMYITRDYVGECSRNDAKGTWLDSSLPLRERYKKLRLPTGLPPNEYYYSCRKHGGQLTCSIRLVKLYLKLVFPGIWLRISKRKSGE